MLTAMATNSLNVSNVGAQAPGQSKTQVIDYDSFEKPGGYTLSDYNAKWSNPYGPGEMGVNDTRTFTGGKFFIDAAPFVTGIDYSVFDHIKLHRRQQPDLRGAAGRFDHLLGRDQRGDAGHDT
ncbi:MAG: hypothetical protein IPM55_04790 [Acidobacteria bacterium]|nr:hypothetical protein [Acidobacteriota bacterium]